MNKYRTADARARVCKENDSFVGLGASHPDVKNIAETLESVKNLGFAGIKLHPDFDDPTMLSFYRELQRLGLCVLVHIGASRFLFGTDFPMWTHEQELEHFLAMNLTEEENQAILYDNFAEFFGV